MQWRAKISKKSKLYLNIYEAKTLVSEPSMLKIIRFSWELWADKFMRLNIRRKEKE
jgi:hypothetical protein